MSFLIYWALGYVAGRCDGQKMEHIELARMGGRARAKTLTDTERSESARRAVNARWDRVRRLKARKLSEVEARKTRRRNKKTA